MKQYDGEELIATGAWRQCQVCKEMHAMDSHIYVCDECRTEGEDGTNEADVIAVIEGLKP